MVENSASIDYVIFALTLAVPTGISIYFGCVNKQHATASAYFYGTGKLKAVPIGLSLFGSAISGSSIIGIVSETYIFGTQYLISYIGTFIALLIQWKFVLPIFCGNLQLKSPYEYYELRFNSTVRIIVAVLYAINVVISLSLCLYITGIVLSDFSGFNLHVCCVVTGTVCTAYTMLGGFTGVIWTDVFQTILIIASCLFTLIKGIIFAGGISNIWSQSSQGHRIQFFKFLTHSDEAPIIYKLSFMYYVVLGTIITIIVGVIVSYITGPNNIHEIDARLIIPCLRPHVNVRQSD